MMELVGEGLISTGPTLSSRKQKLKMQLQLHRFIIVYLLTNSGDGTGAMKLLDITNS